jgi:hypothetical protein
MVRPLSYVLRDSHSSMLSHKGQLGNKYAILLDCRYGQAQFCEIAGKPTNGVSRGPCMNASQVKKSDSEIGPEWHRWFPSTILAMYRLLYLQ